MSQILNDWEWPRDDSGEWYCKRYAETYASDSHSVDCTFVELMRHYVTARDITKPQKY